MTHNSSPNFKVIPFILWTKGSHQSPSFDTFKCSGENLTNFSSPFSNQFSSQFFFKICISLQCHERQLLCTFVAQTIYIYFGHKEPIKTNFLDFQVLRSKFVKFLRSVLKQQVSSSSIFVSFFIAMTHNSSVNFKVIHFLLWTKRPHQSSNCDTFECSGENLLNSSCRFPSNKSVSLQILHPSSVL